MDGAYHATNAWVMTFQNDPCAKYIARAPSQEVRLCKQFLAVVKYKTAILPNFSS